LVVLLRQGLRYGLWIVYRRRDIDAQATLKAPGVKSAIDAAKSKEADKKILLELLQAPEIFMLADAASSDATLKGIPMSLLHAILRVFLSAYGLKWEKFLVGGIFGKAVSDAVRLRQAAAEERAVKGKFAF
jgi:hypothetical protein